MDEIITKNTSFTRLKLSVEEVLNDYRIAFKSREVSLLGRKEVLGGKAKFGIFGDGKEIPQLAMARAFKKGDFRSGYYRDQTFMFAIGELTVREYFAQLYANAEPGFDKATQGRCMNSHFATRSLDNNGNWNAISESYNSSADISPTAGQMPRLVGLGYASKLYRTLPELSHLTQFSDNGNEIAFGTIGNASTSEGIFWESINAIGVLQCPVIMSIWDDGYGISVPNKYQSTKGNILPLLKGFETDENATGYTLKEVKAWNYEACVDTYTSVAEEMRKTHVPALIYVGECTQPQGHSTSGSHERYKSAERLQWEKDWDGIAKMRAWLIENGVISDEELKAIEKEDKKFVRAEQKAAWDDYTSPIQQYANEIEAIASEIIAEQASKADTIKNIISELKNAYDKIRKNAFRAAQKILIEVAHEKTPAVQKLIDWKIQKSKENAELYNSHLHSQSEQNALNIEHVPAEVDENSATVNGFELLRENFKALFNKYPNVVAFGEDVGDIGGVNQTMAGLQDIFGEYRISDTGIRENTIVGQAIGLAMRGIRPIAEIQYLDYLLYGLQIMSDDLATVQYRTKGGQKAPAIIRTRGHRLEGIWHSGSPMGMIINSIRGMYVCVPRNMMQAAGMYNTLLKSDEPALVVEVLNGYRLKEKMPANLGEFTVPLGEAEILRTGSDVTVVSYGATLKIVEEAAERLKKFGIELEIIDVQTLLPFDLNHTIAKSLEKTNKLVVIDEDVSGGTVGFILNKILEEQNAYYHLDAKPMTITAKDHRPAYATDGDYFSKPNTEEIFEKIYGMMRDYNPAKFAELF